MAERLGQRQAELGGQRRIRQHLPLLQGGHSAKICPGRQRSAHIAPQHFALKILSYQHSSLSLLLPRGLMTWGLYDLKGANVFSRTPSSRVRAGCTALLTRESLSSSVY